ncbi:hypothetical protein [Streptomyces violaceus]|uniref:Uncharacterized protein n=1 Tax=Streptomyces violaceus TaxID=1936 RepID=A0ABY9U047_STRVL|nr:hypothetical protein [Streptomyces janthinus]WND16066.1 hypothetical protein RI060_01265 [Streptomyces janthinus]GGS94519.1 hypothetical protein GCM10010270_78190 [Streptomyces janthinus]
MAATPRILIRLAASGKPLVAMGSGGFGIPGRHFSTDVRPDGVDATAGILSKWNGSVYGIANNRLIAG